MKEEWLDKLRTRIKSEYDVKAPEGLLDDIKQEMLHRGTAPVHTTRLKARTVPLWIYRSVSAAAVVAVGLYIGDMLINRSSMTEQVATAFEKKVNMASTYSTAGVRKNDHTSNVVKIVSSIFKGRQEIIDDNRLLASVPVDNTGKENAGDDKSVGTGQPARNTVQDKTESGGNSMTAKRKPQEYPVTGNSLYAHNSSYRLSRFSIGTSYSGAAGTSSNGERRLLAIANPYGNYAPEFSGDKIKSEEIRTETKHHRPFKFGISVRYNINDRWSLQTGLNYSYLSSDFSYSKGTKDYMVEQKLHYIGLPVNAGYSIVKTKRFSVYATVGGEIEKLVKGDSKQTVADAFKADPKATVVKENRPVLSVNAAIGCEYKFSKNLGVYIEPGVGHHFNNGSDVENIYKDKRTNVNLNVGIRIDLNR